MSIFKKLPLVLLLIFPFLLSAQANRPTAMEIVQRAIDSSGGDRLLDSLHGVEFFSCLITDGGDTLSIAVKRKDFNKYYISVLSRSHFNTTKIYNNGTAITITEDVPKKITDPVELDELQLQCYISVDYGYKKLGYKLERLDDQPFKNFDCYVVLAESPNGRKTLNFYDKKSGLVLMTIYPSESKAVCIASYKSNGITSPSQILLVDKTEKVTQSLLQKIDYTNATDTNWFNLSREKYHATADIFHNGRFKYINTSYEAIIVRKGGLHTETSDQLKLEYKTTWTSQTEYLMDRIKRPGEPAINPAADRIKTRITSWVKNKYYCHYITSDNIGGTCAFEKLD